MDHQARNRRPGADRRAQIMQVAADLFEANAYQGTSMEAVAQRVGIRKASLYYYFASKDDLLAQMHLETIEPIFEAHRQRLDAHILGSRDLLLAMMADLVSLAESHGIHMRQVFDHFQELPEPVRTKIIDQRDNYREMIIDVLNQGIADGVFATNDVNLTALAILGMCSWTYQWFRPAGERTTAEIAQHFYDLVMNGLNTG
ncbi:MULTISPECIES: TetR/AcrR family transcriptional regulator [unclassified Frankia]|uniref:TetR/AcrR family transcriptional regulator n=1 Tax=unclassified Frankia TaxID=2632575 RepID=UPI0027DDFE2B|nr:MULTISPECIES: TetR/AcrR family transcriptional regulator [unclassified Frankia]